MRDALTFPIEIVYNRQKVDKDFLYGGHLTTQETLRDIVLTLTHKFAVGNQINVEHTNRTYVKHTILIPKTALDWVKKLIIEFCPSLSFGWLKPNYKRVNCKVKEVCTNSYYNVYPVPQGSRESSKYLNVHQWLTAEPFTKTDLQTAYKTIYTHPASKFYTAKQIAQIAVEELLHNNKI